MGLQEVTDNHLGLRVDTVLVKLYNETETLADTQISAAILSGGHTKADMAHHPLELCINT